MHLYQLDELGEEAVRNPGPTLEGALRSLQQLEQNARRSKVLAGWAPHISRHEALRHDFQGFLDSGSGHTDDGKFSRLATALDASTAANDKFRRRFYDNPQQV